MPEVATDTTNAPLIWLAAGGTGGHLFPAEALGVVLMQRGYRARLVTDSRAAQYGGLFSESTVDIVPSETIRGGNPLLLARTGFMLASGTFKAWQLLGNLNPAAVIGFGGYPTLPPLAAAQFRRIPTIVHDSNAVIGRANRLLARRATGIATAFPDVFAKEPAFAAKTTMTGTPLRPGILAAASVPYTPPDTKGAFRLLVFGGSQGARIMADIVPSAIEKLEPTLWDRLVLTQQVREEDMERVRTVYAAHGIKAELAPFFRDLPARLAASHLVISRSGAGTTAELSGIGRPSILVPLPGAIDQDQFANAGALADAGGAIRLPQTEFTPDRLAAEISGLAAEPARLAALAAGARNVGRLDAAERLADLVTKVAGI